VQSKFKLQNLSYGISPKSIQTYYKYGSSKVSNLTISMSQNTFGQLFRVTTFGESHGKAVGVVVDGCPSGLELVEKDIQVELDRRKPGQSSITTPRKEEDKVQILSGVFEGKTTGAPIAMIVWNKNQKSQDYNHLKNLFRPGHADMTFSQKYKHRDPRGGGRSSARIMIARVAAGAIAKKFLKQIAGIEFLAWTQEIGEIKAYQKDYSWLSFDTSRLTLKSISFEYLQDIFDNYTPEIAKFRLQPYYQSIQQTAEFISSSINQNRQGQSIQLVILDQKNQHFLGLGSILLAGTGTPELTVWIKKDSQSEGYELEAIEFLKSWADKNLNYEYMKYQVDTKDAYSLSTLEALKLQVADKYPLKTQAGNTLNLLEYHINSQVSQDLQTIDTLQQILSKTKHTNA
jgi:RimJ/RimL family protein N-acetyltransferase